MTRQQVDPGQFDEWLGDDSDVAALTLRQWLEPVEGKDAVIFPPTYAKPERVREEDWLGYNIDSFPDGTNVCQIDSIGSQANRVEPIFKGDQHRHLIPQVVIQAGTTEVNILDAGHRGADAIVMFSTLNAQLHEAFLAQKKNGNAELMARIAPTSIVFGSWDSRATQAKFPRIVRSVIRAYNVRPLKRSAQYSTIAGEIMEGSDVEATAAGSTKAELGLAHVPAVSTHGGVMASEIRREATLNLSALRALDGPLGGEITLRLRRYLLGLALVSFTARIDLYLREGCQLVLDPDRPAEATVVNHDGTRIGFEIDHSKAVDFATAVAAEFGVPNEPIQGSFDSEGANRMQALNTNDRRKAQRQGPTTPEAVEQVIKPPSGSRRSRGKPEEDSKE